MTQRDGTYDRIGLIGIQNGRRPMGVLFEARHVSRTEARQRPSKGNGIEIFSHDAEIVCTHVGCHLQ